MRRYFLNRFNRYNLIATIFLTVICLAWIYPFVWIFFASFKTQTAMFSDRWRLWPKPWVWDNYTRAWVAANFSKYFGNTLLYAVWSTAAGVTISAMCGYVLARYHFPGSRLLRIIILGLLFLPVPSTIIPTFQLVKALGLLNTRWGILLAMTGGGAFSTMLFMGAFDAIPQEMYDAAVVDGADFFQQFRLAFPLVRAAIATVVIFGFMGSWNSFFLPLVFSLSRPELRTLAVGLRAFQGEFSFDWTGFAAAMAITVTPVILLFVFFQRNIVNGLAGAVKG
jgi:ABC-type glycerol-3-phosphate transport system permease component